MRQVLSQVRQNLEKANKRVYGRGKVSRMTFLPLPRFRRKQSSVSERKKKVARPGDSNSRPSDP